MGTPGATEGTPEGPEILPGMTRQLTLRLVEKTGVPFALARVTLPELLAADEIILVGTTSEVLSIIELDGTAHRFGTAGAHRQAALGCLSR